MPLACPSGSIPLFQAFHVLPWSVDRYTPRLFVPTSTASLVSTLSARRLVSGRPTLASCQEFPPSVERYTPDVPVPARRTPLLVRVRAFTHRESPLLIACHVMPSSVERYTPEQKNPSAMYTTPGVARKLVVCALDPGSWAQLTPLSVDRKMPALWVPAIAVPEVVTPTTATLLVGMPVLDATHDFPSSVLRKTPADPVDARTAPVAVIASAFTPNASSP